jgi:hypothetical protein
MRINQLRLTGPLGGIKHWGSSETSNVEMKTMLVDKKTYISMYGKIINKDQAGCWQDVNGRALAKHLKHFITFEDESDMLLTIMSKGVILYIL